MSARLGIRIRPETLQAIAFGSINATYSAVGTGFNNPVRIIHMLNNTDQEIRVSWQPPDVTPVETGEDDHFLMPAGSFLLFDLTTNRTESQEAFVGKDWVVWVEHTGVAPTSGGFVVSALYAE